MRLVHLTFALALFALAGCSDMLSPKPAESETSVRTTATVLSVDVPTRKIVIQDEDGARISVIAGSDVEGLEQLSAGDTIAIDYYRSVMAQVAEPGGSDDAIIAVEGGRSAKGEVPSGFGIISTNLIVRLLDYDESTAFAKIRMPDGEQRGVTVPRELRKFVAGRSIGERIEVMVVEAAAISIQQL